MADVVEDRRGGRNRRKRKEEEGEEGKKWQLWSCSWQGSQGRVCVP